jgi:hypothetical protein
MPKLSNKDKFVDFSDYARPLATFLAYQLAKIKVNAIQVTIVFFFVGLASAYCIYTNNMIWAAVFLMTKNILDAVDGEIARITKHPSIIGRYLDSVFDFIINLLILIAIYDITDASILLLILAFLGIEFQCSIYNFYYVIVRQRLNNEETSRIIEYQKPVAYHYESQKIVNILHAMFLSLYGIFDVFVVFLDKKAISIQDFPKWFMSLSSLLGLGFQLLIICILLCFGFPELILPFFAWYSVFGLLVIFIRKIFVR